MASAPTSATSTTRRLPSEPMTTPCCEVGPEADRLAVLERDEHLGAVVLAVIPSKAPSLKTLQFW